MSGISLGDVIGDSFNAYRQDFISHVLGMLVFAVANSLTFSVLYGPLMAGYMRGMRNAELSGRFELGDLFSCFDAKLGPSMVAGIVAIVLLYIGFFFCIIPGLLLMPLAPLAIYQVAVANETDGVNAIKTGFRLLQDNLLMAVLTTLVLTVIGSVGVLACGVGVVLTMPLINIGLYFMARQASRGDADLAPVA
jgi:uncharacterized membrane protein